jgi:hypothetical protein
MIGALKDYLPLAEYVASLKERPAWKKS